MSEQTRGYVDADYIDDKFDSTEAFPRAEEWLQATIMCPEVIPDDCTCPKELGNSACYPKDIDSLCNNRLGKCDPCANDSPGWLVCSTPPIVGENVPDIVEGIFDTFSSGWGMIFSGNIPTTPPPTNINPDRLHCYNGM